MEGFWLASYLILWIFVLLQTSLLIALLRHIGNLRLWLKQAGVIREQSFHEEGPRIGAKIEKLPGMLFDGKQLLYDENSSANLLVFVPAGFFGCDDLLTALKKFAELYGDEIQILIISFEPAVESQFDVVRQRGIRAKIITEYGWKIAQLCNVHTAPYAMITDIKFIVRAKLPVDEFQGLAKVYHAYKSGLIDPNTKGRI